MFDRQKNILKFLLDIKLSETIILAKYNVVNSLAIAAHSNIVVDSFFPVIFLMGEISYVDNLQYYFSTLLNSLEAEILLHLDIYPVHLVLNMMKRSKKLLIFLEKLNSSKSYNAVQILHENHHRFRSAISTFFRTTI